jgi:putative acetyltransferase
MPVTVRRMRPQDARSFLEVHHASVRGLAAADYPHDVIEAWAPLPISDEAVDRFVAASSGPIRLVAEIDGEIVGIGEIVPDLNELRACYVMPKVARLGVGSALMREIEQIAHEHGLAHLQLDASLTSEPFYLSLGYKVRERGEHMLWSGVNMACVKMEKHLSKRSPDEQSDIRGKP